VTDSRSRLHQGTMPTTRVLAATAIALLWPLQGCPQTVSIGSDGDAGPTPTVDSGAGAPPDARVAVEPPPGVTACGGVECAPGEECCLATLECFEPEDLEVCAVSDDLGPDRCSSNRDCGADEFCGRAGVAGISAGSCGGLGECRPRPPAGTCSASDPVCACDGRTYESRCSAEATGVRVAWPWPCGESYVRPTQACESELDCGEGWTCDPTAEVCVELDPLVACALDDHCPAGQQCCPHSGLCFDEDDSESCFRGPEGSLLPCRTDLDCLPLESDLESPGQPTQEVRLHYCEYPECGDLGGCRRLPDGCSGELQPVCGCDGTSYSSACWAADAGVSVASEGECP